MRIILGIHHFPPRYFSGAEREAFNIATGLKQRGHLVTVVCVEQINAAMASGIQESREEFRGLDVRRLSMNMRAAPDPIKWEYDNPWVADYFGRLFAEEAPDLFHLISGYLLTGRTLQIARDMSIPTALSLMDFWFLCPRITMMRSDGTLSDFPLDMASCAQCLGEQKRRYRYASAIAPGLMQHYWRRQRDQISSLQKRLDFQLELLGMVDLIISRSKYLKEVFSTAGLSKARIEFLRQGMETPFQIQTSPTSSNGRILRVGYLGQIAWHKGVDLAIDAMKRLNSNQIELRIYGSEESNPQYSAVLRKRAKGSLNIHFCGTFQGAEELARIFSEMDVIVVPSRWYENSPNVILEAFVHETPVIATDLGGMAELVLHKQNGLLFNLGDIADLTNQIKALIQDPDLVGELRAGIKPVATLDQEVTDLEVLYHRIIS